MAKADKLLAAMRENPRGDWQIGDVKTVCRRYEFRCSPPRRGDHYKISHLESVEILTIPAHRPIKPIYIRRFVAMVDAVIGSDHEGADEKRRR